MEIGKILSGGIAAIFLTSTIFLGINTHSSSKKSVKIDEVDLSEFKGEILHEREIFIFNPHLMIENKEDFFSALQKSTSESIIVYNDYVITLFVPTYKESGTFIAYKKQYPGGVFKKIEIFKKNNGIIVQEKAGNLMLALKTFATIILFIMFIVFLNMMRKI